MNDFFCQAIISILINLVVCFCVYFIGFLYSKTLNYHLGFNRILLGFRLFFGLLITVSIYAVIATSGKSVLLGVLISLLFPIIFRLNDLENVNTIEKDGVDINTFLLFIWAIVFFSIIQLFLVYSFTAKTIFIPHSDFVFYSNVAKSINKSGVENIFPNGWQYSSKFIGYSPYHYFELWISDIISVCFFQNHTKALLLNCNVILLSICYILYASYFKGTRILFIGLSVFLLYPTVIISIWTNTGIFHNFLLGFGNLYGIGFIGQKYLTWIPLCLISYNFYLKGYKSIAIYILSLIVFMSVTPLFILLGVLISFILKFGFSFKKEKINFSVLVVLIPIFLFFTHWVLSAKCEVGNFPYPPFLGLIDQIILNYKYRIELFLTGVFMLIVQFGSLFFGLIYLKEDKFTGFDGISSAIAVKSNVLELFLLMFVGAFSGLIVYCIYCNFFDSLFFFLTCGIFFNTGFVAVSYLLFSNRFYYYVAFVIFISLISIPSAYKSMRFELKDFESNMNKRAFINNVKVEFDHSNSKIVVANLNSQEYYCHVPHSTSDFVVVPQELMFPLNDDEVEVVDLTIEKSLKSTQICSGMYAKADNIRAFQSIWMNFLSEQNVLPSNYANDSILNMLRMNFIDKYNISYIYSTLATLPPKYINQVQIIATIDSINGCNSTKYLFKLKPNKMYK